MEWVQKEFWLFLEGFVEAGKRMVDPHYFQLPIAGKENPIFRERVYCYELYHQIRNALGEVFPFKLDGEVDKNGHPIIPGDKKPDFIVHVPREMDKNLVVIEVKPVIVNDHDLKDDLDKLAWLLKKGKYYRAILLVYGDGRTKLPDWIRTRVALFSKKHENRILLAWHSGWTKEINVIQPLVEG